MMGLEKMIWSMGMLGSFYYWNVVGRVDAFSSSSSSSSCRGGGGGVCRIQKKQQQQQQQQHSIMRKEQLPSKHSSVMIVLAKDSDDDDETNRGFDYLDSLLSSSSSSSSGDDGSSPFSHMIGIPMEDCHDLTLELESVQRAILYHCPILIHACIMPVIMRMPLLYIDASTTTTTTTTTLNPFEQQQQQRRNLNTRMNTGTTTTDDETMLLTSRDPITQAIHAIVRDVVQEMVFTKCESTTTTTTTTKDNDEEDMYGVNQDKVQPLLMNFKGLEVDGEGNEILHAIGMEGNGTDLLRKVLYEIQARCEANGWKTSFPFDPQQLQQQQQEEKEEWRPRLPFMRLPHDFTQLLPPIPDNQIIRIPEEGGNGISPIFFYKWWEDTLCKSKAGVRLRDIAVYGRTGPFGMSELAFYVPHLKTPLPIGNALLQAQEDANYQYDLTRQQQQQQQQQQEESTTTTTTTTSLSIDEQLRQTKSKADRRLLQTIYDSSEDDDTTSIQNLDTIFLDEPLPTNDTAISNNNDNDNNNDDAVDDAVDVDEKDIILGESVPTSTTEPVQRTNNIEVEEEEVEEDETIMTSKTKDIIGSISKPIATGDWSKWKKDNKPKPEDNPILKNWRERRTLAADSPSLQKKKKEKLPPYPSDEHFVGVWRLVSTPRGPSLDQQRLVEGQYNNIMDPTVTENIILRVDGTVAGGPILDFENQHRASGGTWRMFQAEFMGNKNDNNDDDDDDAPPMIQTRLRIRLVIPPEKKRILVMEGEVRRGVSITTTKSVSEDNMKELMSSSSFNIPEMEALRQQQQQKEKNEEDTLLISCAGEVWVEDARTGDNRVKLGRFSVIKAEQNEPNQLRFTIPSPKRYQD